MPKKPKVRFNDFEEDDEELELFDSDIEQSGKKIKKSKKKKKSKKSKKDKKSKSKKKKKISKKVKKVKFEKIISSSESEEKEQQGMEIEHKSPEKASNIIIQDTRRWEDAKDNLSLKKGKFNQEETEKLMHAICQYAKEHNKEEIGKISI